MCVSVYLYLCVFLQVTRCHLLQPLSKVICLCSTVRPVSALIHCSNSAAIYYDLIWICPPEGERWLNTLDWLLMKSTDSGHHSAANKQTQRPHTRTHTLRCVTVRHIHIMWIFFFLGVNCRSPLETATLCYWLSWTVIPKTCHPTCGLYSPSTPLSPSLAFSFK